MLKVSDNKRFLVYDDGRPFFYLGDTVWELFHRLTLEEAELYLQDRVAKGFTVIQAVALAEFDGLRTPNAYGDLPLHDEDPTRPNETYFAFVDAVVKKAAALGLIVGLLPTWGDKVGGGMGDGPEVFTPENASVYGEFLGRRYRDCPMLWMLGGDRAVSTPQDRVLWNALSDGLKRGDGGRHLQTFHPPGGRSSGSFFRDEDWLDFSVTQSGHSGLPLNYLAIEQEYEATPTRPCLDAEPCYEDHPVMTPQWTRTEGWFDDHAVRRAAYWALFAGACGHTYGCHDIWQMWDRQREPINGVRTPWRAALDLPGAGQMRHARVLLESRPFLTRIPDQTLIVGEPGNGAEHVQATRDESGAYAFVYCADGRPISIDLAKLSGRLLRAWWYDPRTGASWAFGEFTNEGPREFTPPSRGRYNDWVLVLDDAAAGFSAPGSLPIEETK